MNNTNKLTNFTECAADESSLNMLAKEEYNYRILVEQERLSKTNIYIYI